MKTKSELETERLKVPKTYKMFVDGKFPRTESGRYFLWKNVKGESVANMCLCSRKDIRDAVTVARAAQPKWAKATAYNRGQILYRIAEILEGRRSQFLDELQQMGSTLEEARTEFDLSVDRLVYYAGWSDKYQQIFSSVNPVASSHFNFSILEPMGVVGVLASEVDGLLGLVSAVAPLIVGGNTAVVLVSEARPLSAVTFGEVLNTSDVPAGVVNILTGSRKENLPHFTTHMDVNAIFYSGDSAEEKKSIELNCVSNIKRFKSLAAKAHQNESSQNPYLILDFQETKTTWHPIGV